ncbi:P2X purinoceptor 7-like [Alosa sapidissima]|uniref:P2X purinoceptor 7-like n=1 Tax=Alosa sapidissima TaxID=34773 RepID=UPI001C088235|nr:P2X purinoceptor 7-like [Alosa sapidissima]
MDTLGVEPYMYEPESEEESDVEEQPVAHRLQMTTSEWCTCGNCDRMPQEREHICCREVPQVIRRMTQVPEEITCMIDHPGLEPVCLNIYSLQNAMNIYRADHGQLRIRGMERQCRHLAYRSFVSWCWGFLGRSVRVVIPSCVVLRIRREFPETSGQYVGFRPPLD